MKINLPKFMEIEPGHIKVSYRSKGQIDVKQIGENWSGGGHKEAAGSIIKKDLQEAINIVLNYIQEQF